MARRTTPERAMTSRGTIRIGAKAPASPPPGVEPIEPEWPISGDDDEPEAPIAPADRPPLPEIDDDMRAFAPMKGAV